MTAGVSPRRRGEESAEACAIAGCTSEAVRSLARVEVRKAFPELSEEGRRAPLCRDHYKQYKKATKQERTLDRLGW
ncbi:MAG TPA: hypothetical protein VGV89_02335 [Thermoplasmata archaeon]|nr:hypothetical protein [Thermoplasmata archaeon]